MSNEYAQKVEILLRMIPIVTEESVFAVHGGSAINLFVRNLPRYSVDLDLTYIPLEDRSLSLTHINEHLSSVARKAKKALRGIHIVEKPDICKLICEYKGRQIKLEVNQTKRGIIGGDVIRKPVCEKAQDEFGLYCETDIVPMTLLYGGKIAAALSRQHPRDLFDVKYMEFPFAQTREGLLFCLLGSDRPIRESFTPSLKDQRMALENQFAGMTDIVFTYNDFEQTRDKLINDVNDMITQEDKAFLLGFECAEPDWNSFEFPHFQNYPSVKWKLQNLRKLKAQNPVKLIKEAAELEKVFK